MTEAKLAALGDYERSEAFTPEEHLVLRLADAMAGTPAVIPDGLFASLRDRFEPDQIVELASALAWENYRARFNRVFDVEAEGFSEGAFCPLPIPGPEPRPRNSDRPTGGA